MRLGTALAALPDDHELVVAARLALELREAHRPSLFDDYAGGRYHRNHVHPEYTDLQRRRWPPTGDRDLWIAHGPDGPPVVVEGAS